MNRIRGTVYSYLEWFSGTSQLGNLLFAKKFIIGAVIIQRFNIFGIMTEVYTVKFLDGWWSRGIRIEGSDFIKSTELWKGTDFYILTIEPWLRGHLSIDDIKIHIKLMVENLPMTDESIRKVTGSNVIIKSRSFWNKSVESQNADEEATEY